MRKNIFALTAICLGAVAPFMTSCIDDDDDKDNSLMRPTAVVTVCPTDDGSFVMNLDNDTRLIPAGGMKSPFEDMEVRALVNYTEENKEFTHSMNTRTVTVNWIDSIRTKLPVPTMGEQNDEIFGNDPIEIVRDWVTVAEDGYLTLRVRTLWGHTGIKHNINLLTGVNPDDTFEVELRHDACGDYAATEGDALIAFNLNALTNTDGSTHKFTLKWHSFSGEKSMEFDLRMRNSLPEVDPRTIRHSAAVK